MKREMKNNKKKMVAILNILQLIFIIMLIYASVEIVRWYLNKKENDNISKEIANSINIKIDNLNEQNNGITKKFEIDFNALKQKNEDAVAFLKVKGTEVETRVV